MMGENIPGAGFGQTPAATSPAPSRTPSSGQDDGFSLWDSDGFGFGDLLDIVNPLQQLPVISTFYRDMTGDDIGPVARVLGGALYGGPIGAAVSFGNVLVDEITGNDVGGHMLAMAKDVTGIDGSGVDGGEASPDGPVMVADASGASPFEDAPADAWVPSQQALANAVNECDHLLVARQVRPSTMSEPAEWEWVRIPKHAGATPQEAGEPLGNPGAAAPDAPAADAPVGAAPAAEAPASGPAPDAPAPAVETGAAPAADPAAAPAGAVAAVTSAPGAQAGRTEAPNVAATAAPAAPVKAGGGGASGAQSGPAQDPLLAEAEKLFRLGLQYEPGSDWARVSGDGDDDEDEPAAGTGAARDEAAMPANPFDPASASAPAGPWVASAMQEGLDKYRAMIGRQAMPGRPALDVDL